MISIIVAIANNGIIGGDNTLLWHISEDLQRFRRLTTGHPVVMGRKTFESIGKPLPGRTNVVVTRQPDYKADGCTVVHSLEEAIELFPPEEEIFIIGGGEMYRQAWNRADRLYITWIGAAFDGDTYLPDEYVRKLTGINDAESPTDVNKRKGLSKLDLWRWQVVFRQRHERGSKFEYPFEFIDYRRVQRDIPFPDL